ncbi:MAG: hypothetical protein ACI9WM_000915 [Arenicella sp.]|jgi:hypothetical protein
MKKVYLIIFLFIGVAASAQAPDKMSYQAVIRDANGEILKNQDVSIQFSVLQTSISGTSVYQEDHKLTTNSNGLVSVYMGIGAVSSGDFSTIDWSDGTYFLKTEIDPTGGSNYTIISTTELVSVPYAVYANKAEFADSLTGGVNETDPIFDGSVAKGISTTDTAYWNDKLDSYSETDPVFDASVAKGITAVDTAYWNSKLDGYTETDPLFDASVAKGVTAVDTAYWNGKFDTTSIIAIANGGTGSSTQNFVDLSTVQMVAGDKTFSSDIKVNGITVGIGGGADSTNIATGRRALSSNTTGIRNTANGFEALISNTTGNNNTANGYFALISNTTGSYNTAIGTAALYSNTVGTRNIATGYRALFANTTGSYNTANGSRALYSNTTGYENTANGANALKRNTTGEWNAANGIDALYYNTTGSGNTAMGPFALYSNTTGSNNTGIGNGASASSNNLSNSTALGSGATVSASNRVRIGNSSVSRIGGTVAWTNLSDGRIKENVQEAVPGLSFISQLRPVTYTLNTRKQDDITMQAMPDSIKEKRMLSDADYLESSSIVRTGFIAQEVEAAAQKVGFDFDGVSTPQNETDLYGIRYAEFVVPLVKAMQEQQEIIEQQKNDFQRQLQLLLERIESLEKE